MRTNDGGQSVVARVMSPSECEEVSGLSVETLSLLIRARGYLFTSRRPGGQPGDRGRGRWGLTPAQLAAIVAGEQRRFRPDPEDAAKSSAPKCAPPGGKSRIRRLQRPR